MTLGLIKTKIVVVAGKNGGSNSLNDKTVAWSVQGTRHEGNMSNVRFIAHALHFPPLPKG